MHLGLVIYGSLNNISGGYLYDRRLVEYLWQQGDTVEIISIPWRNYPAHLTDNINAHLHRRLKFFQGDILLQDELNHPSLFRLNQKLISRLQYLPYPILSIVHHLRVSEGHPAWLMPLYRAVERAYLRTLSGFVFNSWTTKRVVERLLGQEIVHYVVSPPGGDRFPIQMKEEDIVRRAYQPGPIRLLFIGNVVPRKGLHTVFEALSLLQESRWELHIAGSLRVANNYARRLKKEMIQKRWEEKVFFHGPVEDVQLMALAMDSHVLVMPSSYEGFGIAYLEGMGFGLPAIGTTSGAAREIIADGENGFLVNPGDYRTLADHLDVLAADRSKLASLSLHALRQFAAQPGWNERMAAIRNFLACLL